MGTNDKQIKNVFTLPKKVYSLKSGEILIKRAYWVHNTNKTFKWNTTELRNSKIKRYDLVFLQYPSDGEPRAINIAPHGNAKMCKRPLIIKLKYIDIINYLTSRSVHILKFNIL